MSNPCTPCCHFVPPTGWMNDPNGLVYFRGRWHLFYQFYDPRMVDGMQWGHALSDDLLRWQHLPPAIVPDRHGHIWSGSAVVDQHDSSGLFHGEAGMVCLFTYWDKSDHRQCQGMAYSADGLTFQTWKDNPVIPQLRYLPGHPDDKDFRDPKVFWHHETGRWIMAIAGGRLRFFSSPDLIHWTFESISNDIVTECPDLFRLPVADAPGQSFWVLSRGGRSYMLGEFDGKRFTPVSDSIPLSNGPDFYATQSFSDAPDGRRIIVSWLHQWGYGSSIGPDGIRNAFTGVSPAGGCLSIPGECRLRSTAEGPRLFVEPVAECGTIASPLVIMDRLELRDTKTCRLDIDRPAADLRFTVAACERRCGLRIYTGERHWVSCGYDASAHALFIDRRRSGLDAVTGYSGDFVSPPLDGRLPVRLRVLLDACSLELFGNDGEAPMAAYVLPDPDDCRAELFGEGRALLQHVSVSTLT